MRAGGGGGVPGGLSARMHCGLACNPSHLSSPLARPCREVEQLQADNAELQAELQHLAATLRAALAAAPDGTSGVAAASLGGSVDLAGPGVQHLDGFLPAHDHTHLQLGHSDDCCHESRSITASMLSSVDTPPAALEHALDEHGNGQGPQGTPAVPPVYHQPTAVSRATLSCSMQHPGSICCTKLSSAVDPSGAACTISLHTTARCALRGTGSGVVAAAAAAAAAAVGWAGAAAQRRQPRLWMLRSCCLSPFPAKLPKLSPTTYSCLQVHSGRLDGAPPP